MPLITSEHFPRYSWWRHLSSNKVFVIISVWPEKENERVIEILFEKTNQPEWRTEHTLLHLLTKKEIQQI